MVDEVASCVVDKATPFGAGEVEIITDPPCVGGTDRSTKEPC